jgi:hypothetical protein
MNKKSTTKFLLFGSLFSLFIIALFIGCESSRVGPELPRPNPAPPPPQPIVLEAKVRDISNLTAIAGATVRITKADNTLVTTLLTDNSGKFSYDVTALTENTLSVSASKDGYGFGNKVAEIKKSINVAVLDDILLAKLVVASAPVTPASGGTASTTSTQTVSAKPLTVTVPPNAVPQNITLTVAAVPAAQVPPPPAASQSIQTAMTLGPSGTQFAVPVTVSFPMPNKQPAGKTFSLLKLNETTRIWANTGITATVDATGTNATAALSSFSTYATADELSINIQTGTTSTANVETVSLSSGSTTKSYAQTSSISITTTGTVSSSWLLDEVTKASGINVGSVPKDITFNFPELPANYVRNGLQYNPDKPNEAGNWKYNWTVIRITTTRNYTASGGAAPDNYSASGQIISQKVDIVAATPEWVWVAHNQGGLN